MAISRRNIFKSTATEASALSVTSVQVSQKSDGGGRLETEA